MKITKDFFRKCEQRNVRLDKDYYTDGEIYDMRRKNEVTDIGDWDWVIFLRDIERIEVEVNEFKWIATVAYLKDGARLYVEI